MGWPRRLGLTGLAATALGGAAFWALSAPFALPPATLAAIAAHPTDAAAGERVFWAAGCAGCHAAPGLTMQNPVTDRLVLSGGRRLVSDFGTFVAPNISPHPTAGIGGWTQAEFATALLAGVSPGGGHYYPSFPYTSYARMTPQNVADLWEFWQSLPPDATPSAPHELAFPYTLRRGVGLWKRLHLRTDFVTPPSADPQRERGRYLVEALAHCGECHTPRAATGGLDTGAWMRGAPNPSGQGRIPPIPAADWSTEDIEAYLFSGFTPSFDVVGGSMSDVVAHMAQLPGEDRAAIAAYLVALRASPSR
jgi:mono/diheme cytochrome c family protein